LFSVIKEIMAGRNLIFELVIKDLKLRYSRPLLGFFWALILPLVTVLIFYVIFSLFLKVKIQEAPFILYLMSAVFPWRFFQDSLSGSVTSLWDNKNLLREARFPHYFIPLSIVVANAVNALPSLVILAVAAFFVLKGVPGFIVFLPVVLAAHFLMTLGLAIILSLLYLKWRDMKYFLEAVLLFLFYLTPGFYSLYLAKAALAPWAFRLFLCNPFTGILNFYRFTLLKGFYGSVSNDVGLFSLIMIPVVFAISVAWFGFYFYRCHKNDIYDHLSY